MYLKFRVAERRNVGYSTKIYFYYYATINNNIIDNKK